MATKRPVRARGARVLPPGVRRDGDLAAIAAQCAEHSARIDRLELDYATQVRRCAELQAEIDLLKRVRSV